jgi:hypothetical protein
MDTRTSLYLFAGALAANSQIAGNFVRDRASALDMMASLFTPAILLGCAFLSLSAALALVIELRTEKSD